MTDVYIIGIHATPVARYMDLGFKDLTRKAYRGALQDAGLEDGDAIQFCYFSNYMGWTYGQYRTQGNCFCIPLKNEGLMPPRLPIFNVEAGCASGSMAVHSAWKDILSGQSDVVIAIGVEKMHHPNGSAFVLDNIAKGEDHAGKSDWLEMMGAAARAAGVKVEFAEDRSIAMDFYALLGREHMQRYGTTQRQFAAAASKNHRNSLGNPRSQYHFDLSVEDVLNDRLVSYPLTRAMCAPIGDGAAATILCSSDYLGSLPRTVRDRAILIRASTFAGGTFQRSHQDDRASATAAERAYAACGLKPADIDVVELHDATSIAEILLLEDLQLCKPGYGGPFTASGATALDGEVAVNPSGGLVARGHPIGATGIMMLNELSIQLRGEAGRNQVPNARVGLQENGGGLIGLDVAICGVTILERVG